jgi:ABC-type multidrug transport system permease subunit
MKILRNNAYHSPEESETDPDNDEGKRRIVVYDYTWRSNEVCSLIYLFHFLLLLILIFILFYFICLFNLVKKTFTKCFRETRTDTASVAIDKTTNK